MERELHGASADNVRDNARAKGVRASYGFWSTGDEALLERAFAETFAEHLVGPPYEPPAIACSH
jgi:hypothetical protein